MGRIGARFMKDGIQMTEISWFAVIVAAAASFGFGSVYYMVLSTPWVSARGKTMAEMQADQSARPFIVAALSQILMASILARVIAASGPVTMENGIGAGFLMWLGFVLTTMAVNHGFQGAKRELTLIDGGHWLGVLVIQGLVLGIMGA